MSNETVIQKHFYDPEANKIFGFWIYLMSDCIIFATLFATYMVMVHNTAFGPIAKEIFKLPFVFLETMILLLSSIIYGMAVIAMDRQNKILVVTWLILTGILGSAFIIMELYEFYHLIMNNCGPNRSGFLSAFFTLVGVHGLHVSSGLIWMAVLILQIIKRGLTKINCTRIICLSMFWHFLDIIWIFVFSVVYLIGTMQ
ncbi:cytochrome o ubiquinol oxidase subunit III [Candidatus Pantoea carbekii]|uniref:Cytochrome bo(3) ubiquinol oxidase subunit 3 n=1 Tax=Candidatus Pantoea carbekii TaxID=1235990 RepID=U3U6Z2_9GAMM|nr:cytochrome o ubiquinol oxidase subunit III [Candidatus Pantoea carbekii]AKC32229.1 cytochrome o ubiquinol oxidase subunit III CyoC [Candidatus Pantoea carbekii]BAO00765.1 CyoC protein [Candidatus Pantoea carbekii]